MKRICKLSGREFLITDGELEFYKKFELPVPELSPEERRRQRLAFRNESSIYHRVCDGTKNQIISMYKPDSEYKVYDNDYWWGDNWDALDYGQEYVLAESFLSSLVDYSNVCLKWQGFSKGIMKIQNILIALPIIRIVI